jgi:hypothetical protein
MAAFNKFQDYAEQKNRGVHNWGGHTFKLALSNVAPAAGNSVLADITQIAAGNGYVAGGTALTGVTISETGGTVTVQANQVVFTAAGGAIAAFRYYVLYNDTSASDNLVAWWDHGAAVNLADGDSFTVKFNNASPGTIFTDS